MFFSESFLERSTENTLAASVEPSTAPVSRPSNRLKPSTMWQNRPVRSAVEIVPRDESSSAFTAIGRAVFQRVPKPP